MQVDTSQQKTRDDLAGFLQFEARCAPTERRIDAAQASVVSGDRAAGQRIERPVSVRPDATVALVSFVFVRGVSTLS